MISIIPAAQRSRMLECRTTKGSCWCDSQPAVQPHLEGLWQREGHTPTVLPPQPENRLPVLGRTVNRGKPGEMGGSSVGHRDSNGTVARDTSKAEGEMSGMKVWLEQDGWQEEPELMDQKLCLASLSMSEIQWWSQGDVIASLASTPPEFTKFRKTVKKSPTPETTKDRRKIKSHCSVVAGKGSYNYSLL